MAVNNSSESDYSWSLVILRISQFLFISCSMDVPMRLAAVELSVISSESSCSEHHRVHGTYTEYLRSWSDSPQSFSLIELNDRTRDLDLSKEQMNCWDLCWTKKKITNPKKPIFIGAKIEKTNLLDTLRERRTWYIIVPMLLENWWEIRIWFTIKMNGDCL